VGSQGHAAEAGEGPGGSGQGGSPGISACGNGILEADEECDDENAETGDGCAACAQEPGWTCQGEPSSCDGVLDGTVLSGTWIAAVSSAEPTNVAAPIQLAGLDAGETLVSIDRRPVNGMLYGLGFNADTGMARLYSVSAATGQCTAIGPAQSFVDVDGTTAVPVLGTAFGIDVDPVADLVRVVTDAGQNFRISPESGAFFDANGAVDGIQGDGSIGGQTSTVAETAYSNNGPTAAVTTQYTIDTVTDALYIQNPSNAGTQTNRLPLSSALVSVGGFDIPAGVNVTTANTVAAGSGLAIVRVEGESEDLLARVDLTTGELLRTSAVGSGLLGFAAQNVDSIPMLALSATGTQILRFSSTSPGTTLAATVMGLTSGETLVGLDWRPQTGQLVALGINATANTGTLYRAEPRSGRLIVIGTPGSLAFVDTAGDPVDLPPAGTGYGIDVNPTTDRVRVVTNSGLNFRANPSSGAPVDGDPATAGVNPDGTLSGLSAGTGLVGAAHTNNYGQAPVSGVTTLYGLDADADGLVILSPAASGAAVGFVAIRAGSARLDFTASGGFDIADDVRVEVANEAADGVAYAALTVDGTSRLFALDLETGEATDLGAIGDGTPIGGLAVGHFTVQ
jgi:cysteine-rich repeat protein